MACSNQTQFYKALVRLATTGATTYQSLPALPNTAVIIPKNYYIPPIIGNYWAYNYAEGLQVPMAEVQIVPRHLTTEALAYNAAGQSSTPDTLLEYLYCRSNDVYHDTSAATAFEYWDGHGYIKIDNPKVDMITLSCAKGEPLRMVARLVGSTFTVSGATPANLTTYKFDASAPIMFKDITFGGGLADKVHAFTLTYMNNHVPNPGLNGSNAPCANNAGMQTVTFDFVTKAADVSSGVYLTSGGNGDGTSVAFSVVVGAATLTFTMGNVINNTQNVRRVTAPHILREHSLIALGSGVDGQASPPLAITVA